MGSMSLGGDIDYATAVDNALDQITTGIDHLLKAFAEGALSSFDNAKLISVMQNLEQTGTGSRSSTTP